MLEDFKVVSPSTVVKALSADIISINNSYTLPVSSPGPGKIIITGTGTNTHFVDNTSVAGLTGNISASALISAIGVDQYIGSLQSDIAELAFDMAILQNVGLYEMADGVAITYDDSTGIHAVSSSNYAVDTTNEKVANRLSTTDSYAGSFTNYAISNWCVVEEINQSLISGSGTSVRVQMIGSPSADTVYDDVFISRKAAAGDAYDSHTDLTRLTFSGANSVTIPQGTAVWSDWVTYSLDGTQNLLVCADVGAVAGCYNTYSGFTHHYKAATNAAATANRTGFSSLASRQSLVTGIQYRGDTLSMVLVSTAYTAATAPGEAAFTMRFVEPNSDVTLNTDLIVQVSRDGGTTWSTVTLTELRTSGTTVVVSGTVNLSSQPSGTSLRSKITTPGGTPKAVEIIAHTLQLE